MKFLLTIILLGGFIGIAAFGYFDIHAGIQDHKSGCALAASQGKDCSPQASPVNQLDFHLNALRSFSTATFGDNLLTLLFLFSLIMIGAGTAMMQGNLILLKPQFADQQRDPALFNFHSERALLRWLTLHENSPSIL